MKYLVVFLLPFLFKTTGVAQLPLFKDGDQICFIGNSITMDGRYYKYLELFYTTRQPKSKITFYNCGISGDNAAGILRRIDSDVFALKPTWAVLMIGMNDVNRSLYQPARHNDAGIKENREKALEVYRKNVDSIVRLLIRSGSKVVLQTPSIYDQTSLLASENDFGVNDALGKCADFIKVLSGKYQLPIVNYWDLLNRVNEHIHKKDLHATIIGKDRVHPGVDGHFLMAGEFLKTQHAPGYVSKICFDVRKKSVREALNCRIDDIRYGKKSLVFQSLEESLPFPLLTATFNPDSLFGFNNMFNKEILQLKGLKKGVYELLIDSVRTGVYSKNQLSNGINLALNPRTPQYLHAAKVLDLLEKYWNITDRLRQIKYVEYQFLRGDTLQKFDAETISKRFDKILERYAGQPQDYLAFYKDNFKDYIINKPLETELQEEARTAADRIHQMNVPVKHRYEVISKK